MIHDDIEVVIERALVFVRLIAVAIIACVVVGYSYGAIETLPAIAIFSVAGISFSYIDWVAAVLDSEPWEDD